MPEMRILICTVKAGMLGPLPWSNVRLWLRCPGLRDDGTAAQRTAAMPFVSLHCIELNLCADEVRKETPRPLDLLKNWVFLVINPEC